MILANNFADSPAQIFLTVLGSLTVMLIGGLTTAILKLVRLVDKVGNAVYPPPPKESLPDQVENIRDDLRLLRVTGSDKLKEILDETRLQRVETARERQRQIGRERIQDGDNLQDTD